MSDGKIHDIVTFVTVLPVAFLLYILVGKILAIFFTIGYIFAGLMFNGDLDTISTPYYRWGIFRWIWIPYRKFGHRSSWTHGFLRGTGTRLLWVSPLILFALIAFAYNYGIAFVAHFFVSYWQHIFIFIIGLEAGSMSHTLADISSSKI